MPSRPWPQLRCGVCFSENIDPLVHEASPVQRILCPADDTTCCNQRSGHLVSLDSFFLRAGPAEMLIRWLSGDAPPNSTYWDVHFPLCVDHAPTNKRKTRLFSVICSRDVIDTTIRTNTKTTMNCLAKKNRKKTGSPFVCTCGSNMRVNFRIETRQI